MSSGAQQSSYIIKEVTPGVTPTSGTWNTMRLTGNTLSPAVATETSDEITDSRLGQGSVATAVNINGELTGEMSFGTFDDLLEAAFYGTWTGDVLTIGSTRHTFSIVKAYKDINVYGTFKGAHVSTFALDIPGEGKVTATFGMMCMDYVDAAVNPVTSPAAPTTTPFMSSLNIGDIKIDGVSAAGVACVSGLTFNLDNTIQVQRCLGSGKIGPGALIATAANGTGTITMAWSAKAWDIWKKQMTRAPIAVEFPVTDALGNAYLLNFPALEVDGELPSGGRGDLLEIPLNYTVAKQAPTITRVPAEE